VLYIIGACLWTLEAVASWWCLKTVRCRPEFVDSIVWHMAYAACSKMNIFLRSAAAVMSFAVRVCSQHHASTYGCLCKLRF
jgi:hypothetical protein